MHALNAAFFRAGEARGGLLVRFAGGEPDRDADPARAVLERHGLEVARLEGPSPALRRDAWRYRGSFSARKAMRTA